jgi:hypothetical protein
MRVRPVLAPAMSDEDYLASPNSEAATVQGISEPGDKRLHFALTH